MKIISLHQSKEKIEVRAKYRSWSFQCTFYKEEFEAINEQIIINEIDDHLIKNEINTDRFIDDDIKEEFKTELRKKIKELIW